MKNNFDLLEDKSFLKYSPLYIIRSLSRYASVVLLDKTGVTVKQRKEERRREGLKV